MIDFIKIVILSLIAVFIGHQIFNYVKSKYIDSNATLDMLRESKKMYEDVASALNISKSKTPNKRGNNVSIHEEDNLVKMIPNREDTTPINTTSLDSLLPINQSEVSEVDMQDELTKYINNLSA
jgi:regulatory protein YycI of two-component signal transduction system YycFG